MLLATGDDTARIDTWSSVIIAAATLIERISTESQIDRRFEHIVA